MTTHDITEDDFLGGLLRLRQPRNGYRIGIDTVLLAAAVQPKAGAKILDMGTGTGGVALCLAARLKQDGFEDFSIDCLELQENLKNIAAENIALNNMADRLRVVAGDVQSVPDELLPNSYDHVLSNPPYVEAGRGTPPPNGQKAMAHMDSHVSLSDWVRHCLRMTRPRGFVTLVHRADRLDDILAGLRGKAGDVVIYPLWPAQGQAAKRVLVQARKGGKGPLRLSAGLVLHKGPQEYTPEVEAILRHGAGLDLMGE